MPRLCYVSCRSRQHGFTLIEILIVLGIIALLASLLFTVFSSARNKARTVACASNLRQIGLAIEMYVNDHNNIYPSSLSPGLHCGWADRLERYVRTPSIFWCPAFANGEYRSGCPLPDTSVDPPIKYHGSYDRVFLGVPYFGLRVTHFQRPSSTITLLDGQGDSVNPGSDPIASPTDLLHRGVVPPRHGNGLNVMFLDGHVKWMSLDAMAKRSLWLTTGPE